MNQQQRILYKTKRDQKLIIKSIGAEYIGYFRLTNTGDFVIAPRINSRHYGKYLNMEQIQEIKDFKTNEILFSVGPNKDE